jgi:pyruvate-formate lyase-activating enzyme
MTATRLPWQEKSWLLHVITASRGVCCVTNPDVLGILLTSKCNLVCRHCCNDSSPEQSSTLSIERIRQLIDEAGAVPSIRDIGFRGGEPFLFYPLLLEAVDYARSRGFGSSVTSNGYWGHSRRAPGLIAELGARGLTSLVLSTSLFHGEFVSRDAVAAAATAALDQGLEVTINVVASSSYSAEDAAAAFEALAADVRFVVMPLIPTGRAAEMIESSHFPPPAPAVPLGNCSRHFRKMAVDTKGDLYPCCSPGGFTPALKLGNIAEAPLADVAGRARSHPVLSILDSVGPAFFLPFVRAAGVDEGLPGGFVDQCHLCHAIFSSKPAAAVARAAAGELMTQLAQLNSGALGSGDPLAARCRPSELVAGEP